MWLGIAVLIATGVGIIVFSGRIGGLEKRGSLGGPEYAELSVILLGLFLVACGIGFAVASA
jgi:hypothetical protein